MRVTIHQPEHLPWLGLLAKINSADLFVVLDNVPYRKNYFQNRNRLANNGVQQWLTVPAKPPFGTLIQDVVIADSLGWQERYLGRMASCLTGPNSEDVLDTLAPMIAKVGTGDSLRDLNLQILEWVSERFSVQTPVRLASSMDVSGFKGALLIDICREVGADSYIAGPSGRDYLDAADFEEAGIDVRFFDFEHPVYEDGPCFVPGMSAVDAIARLRESELSGLLEHYELSPQW